MARMKVLVYSTKPFEVPLLEAANNIRHTLVFTEKRLDSLSTHLALNFDAISVFSADDVGPIVLEKLKTFGVKYITLRSAGFDNVSLRVARKFGIRVANAPGYSPNAIAEHAITLLLSFNRKIARAQYQTLQDNFLLDDLIGFDLVGKTVGVMGTGKIGSALVKMLHGFGCIIKANDSSSNKQLITDFRVEYISKDAMASEVDILFICLPLTKETHHLLNQDFIGKCKKQPIIVNIARGAVVHTEAILKGLDTRKLKGYLTDVYEKEHGVFFYDRSLDSLKDPLLHRLLCHPKTLVTPHQAFATKEALENIAITTMENLNTWESGKHAINELC